jgi:phenylacetate-CoA ligase
MPIMPLHSRFLHRHVVYPAIVRLRGEEGVFDALARLQRLEQLPAEELRAAQQQQLRTALVYAAARSAYYRDHWPALDFERMDPFEALAQLPLVDKTTLQRHGSALEASPRPTRITRKTTGGSTGQAVTVLKDRGALAHEMAASWLAYGWFGVQRGDRAARFWGDPFTLKRKLRYAAADFAMNRLRFSAFAFDAAALRRYWERTCAFRPDYLYGYTSMLTEFARFVRAQGYDGASLGLKVVISTSEVLSDVHRQLLCDTFACPVQNEYGCGEVGPVAYGCEAGGLHVMTSNVVLEVLRSDGSPSQIGEPGELVVTDLNNRAMPLVRYRVGDFGVPAAPCSCGRPYPTLERIFGRAYDFILGLDGSRFHGEFFMYLFEELRQAGHAFDQFQVVQTDARQIRADLVSAEAPSAALQAHLTRRLEEHLPGIRLTVRHVPEIPRAASGKMRVIVNEVAQPAREEPVHAGV